MVSDESRAAFDLAGGAHGAGQDAQSRDGASAPAAQQRFPARARAFLGRNSTPGLVGALLFYCISLTPSLLPRTWFLQAVVSGITVTIGYAVGTFVGWLLKSLVPWRPSESGRRAIRSALALAAAVLVPLFGVLGARWQHETRQLVGSGQASESAYVLVVVVSILMAAGAVLIFRGLVALVRAIARRLGRYIPPRAATAAAMVIVLVVLIVMVDGVLPRAALGWASSVFGAADETTDVGVGAPQTPLRSGSPESLVRWDTLGRQGRAFVGEGPTPEEISAFSGSPAMEPIRTYVGLRSARSIEAQAALAVRELERTGAFQRKVLLVTTTTGTGWLNQRMVGALEKMYNGDTAVIALQYSYLPSWISFLVDRSVAQEAGRELFDAVYARWEQLPVDQRPQLVPMGESLGSLGSEAAFSGVEDIRNRTSGVLWVGPPNSNRLWSRFTAARDPGSPEWLPVFEGGRTVRFAATADQIDPQSHGWERPRVVYLQNPSDPIVWWSPDLAFHRPDWLRATHPPDVSPQMRWYPFVTFWQVSADLAFSTGVPPGHGHTYGVAQAAAAWAAIVPPPGWTPERTAELAREPGN